MFLHRIPCQSGSLGEGGELRDLRVEAHIVPQLALRFCQLDRRGGAPKLLLEIFLVLVPLRGPLSLFYISQPTRPYYISYAGFFFKKKKKKYE